MHLIQLDSSNTFHVCADRHSVLFHFQRGLHRLCDGGLADDYVKEVDHIRLQSSLCYATAVCTYDDRSNGFMVLLCYRSQVGLSRVHSELRFIPRSQHSYDAVVGL